jgi:hypothetical protein
MTDLGEIVRTRLAEKARAGKRPTQADLVWLEATQERTPPSSSVEISRNAKGEMQFAVKVAHADPHEAEKIATAQASRLRAMYPMADGAVGSPEKTP